MRRVWVFGSGKSIGKALVKRLLSCGDSVVAFSRSAPEITHDNLQFRRVDFEDERATRIEMRALLQIMRPDAAVFCQRYRPEAEINDYEALKRGLNVELGPPVILTEELSALNDADINSVAIVLISSIAGLFIHRDLPLSYHIHKSNLITLTRYLASKSGRQRINANCIVLGEFLKYPVETYTPQERNKFAALEKLLPSAKAIDLKDVLSVIEFLIGASTQMVTGQVLQLDGGLSLLAQEAVVREMLQAQRDSA